MMRRRTLCSAAALASLGVSAAPGDAISRALSEPKALPDRELPLAYFGTHFHRLAAVTVGALPTAWPEAMIGSLRLWDSGTRWGDLAPRPGVWSFDRMDFYVEKAAVHGASVLHTLGSTPPWASARPDEPGPYGPGCAAEPARLADWEDYVARVVERYRGRIQAYELWNEPQYSDYAVDREHPGFFTGSMAQMVEMARVARRVLDRVDPAALLTTPGFVNGHHRLDLFLRSGGAECVQVVAYHLYARDAFQFAQQVVDVKAVMRQRGVARLPLWNTECGIEPHADGEALRDGATRRLSPTGAAAMLAQFLLLGAAVGLERFFYYAWDNERSGLVDRWGEAKPGFDALRRVEQWLIGTQLSGGRSGDSAVCIDGERGGERFVFAWSASERSARIASPSGWRISSCEPLLDVSGRASPRASGDGSWIAVSAAPARLRLVRA